MCSINTIRGKSFLFLLWFHKKNSDWISYDVFAQYTILVALSFIWKLKDIPIFLCLPLSTADCRWTSSISSRLNRSQPLMLNSRWHYNLSPCPRSDLCYVQVQFIVNYPCSTGCFTSTCNSLKAPVSFSVLNKLYVSFVWGGNLDHMFPLKAFEIRTKQNVWTARSSLTTFNNSRFLVLWK